MDRITAITLRACLFFAIVANGRLTMASLFSVSVANPVVDIDLDADEYTDFRFAAESNPVQGNFFRVESPLYGYPPSPVRDQYPPSPVMPLPPDASFPVGTFDTTTAYLYNTLAVAAADEARVQSFSSGATLSTQIVTSLGNQDAGTPTMTLAQDFFVSGAGSLNGDLFGNGGLIIPSDFSPLSHYFAGTFFAGLDDNGGPTTNMVVFDVSFSPSGDEMDINRISIVPGLTVTAPEPSGLVLGLLSAVALSLLAIRRRRAQAHFMPTVP